MNKNTIITILVVLVVAVLAMSFFNKNNHKDKNIMDEIGHEVDEVGDEIEDRTN